MVEAARLSDTGWQAICIAAKLRPDDSARAEIEACLFAEYPVFAYDPKRTAADLRRARQMLQHCEALAELYGQAPAHGDDIKRERDLFYLERLRRSAEARVAACQVIRHANKGRSNPQREWLIGQLCGIWLDNFGGERLTVTVADAGPCGPLIDFLLAAMRQIIRKQDLPPPETLRGVIDRERQGRENTLQLLVDLKQQRQRANGDSTREK